MSHTIDESGRRSPARSGSHTDPTRRGWLSPEHPPRVAWVAWLLFVVALAPLLIDIGGKSLWVDEGATYVSAQPDLETIVDTQHVAHPSGYYALIHLVSSLNESEAGLRIPSALAAAGTVVLIYLIGRRLLDHRVGLFAAALSAVSPLSIWYGQEARQAAPAAFFVALGIHGLTVGRWRGWLIALAALVVGLFIDYVTALGWVALGSVWTYLWWRRHPVRVWEWSAVTLVGGAVFAAIDWSGFSAGFDTLLDYDGAGWYGSILGGNPVTSNPVGLLVVVYLLGLGAVALVGTILTRSRHSRRWAGIAAWSFVFVVAAFAVPRAYSVKKLLIVGWPIILLFVAYLVWQRMNPRTRTWAAGTLLVVSMISSAITMATPKDDWRGATAYINARAAPQDTTWTAPDAWAADAYLYYDGNLPVERAADPADSVPATGDVWMITKRRPQDSVPALEAEAWFDEHWELVEEEPFYRLAVRHYVRR